MRGGDFCLGGVLLAGEVYLFEEAVRGGVDEHFVVSGVGVV